MELGQNTEWKVSGLGEGGGVCDFINTLSKKQYGILPWHATLASLQMLSDSSITSHFAVDLI